MIKIEFDGIVSADEGMRPNERKVLSQSSNGEWIVAIPGPPPMSFAAAVRARVVRV